MPVYHITEPRLGRLRVHAWRHRAWRTLGVLLLTLLCCVVGLVLLDPSAEPLSQKAFLALWNAGNLITTLGDFTEFSAQQKAFLMVAMFTFLGIGGYAVTTLTGMLSSDALMRYRENKSMERIVDRLANHVIVVGFGSVGRLVAGRLQAAGDRVLVIERDDTVTAQASEVGHLVVLGDAGMDATVFDRAGIQRARALVVTSEDADRKVAITLMAHSLKSDLKIVVTGRDHARGALLQRAGASEVVVLDDLVAGQLVERVGRNAGT